MTVALFEQRLAADWPVSDWGTLRVVVAVSGGADSIALLRGLAAIRAAAAPSTGELIVAHFEHGLRGEESTADCEFVQHLASSLGLRCEVGHATAESLTEPGQDGIEAAARAARYDFLRKTAARWGARYVATAHTSNDVAETILHRVLRGTGLAGLIGIPRVRPLSELTTLIRPLLSCSRQEVESYLQELGQPYRNDSSNNDSSFMRNRIRRELLPLLARDFNPQVQSALLRLASQAEETLETLDGLLSPIREAAIRRLSPTEVALECQPLVPLSAAARRHILRRLWQELNWPMQEMTAEKWEELAAVVDTPRAFDLPGPVSVRGAAGKINLSYRAS